MYQFQILDSNLLLRYAASAMDAAKSEVKNQLAFFDPADYERRLAAIELQAELETAVNENFSGCSLQYQSDCGCSALPWTSASDGGRHCLPFG